MLPLLSCSESRVHIATAEKALMANTRFWQAPWFEGWKAMHCMRIAAALRCLHCG